RASIETMEAGRWDSLWFADHFFPPWGGPKGDRKTEHRTAFEGYTLIAVAAGMTEKLRLGHLVLGNTYRNPALLAKMATTLDQASKGRFTLALGAGWCEREHDAFGWDFPSMKERSDRFQEACELIRKLFTADGPIDYNGRYYRLNQAPLSPGCYQKPHIPILVGGTGERRTLRTLAMHGDIFNFNAWGTRNLSDGMSVASYQYLIGVLERHCEEVGRDPAEIRGTIHMPLNLTDDKESAKRSIERLGPGAMAGPRNYIVDRIGEFDDAGVEEIMFPPFRDAETVQRVEEEIVAAFD
ncbi:MAG: LLM class flavin-dependent oxidoreductase, partial [SAR324 cluster bacterium]|nr:LLM class flavin-dependent oxidoreductase [SAR324 cluster bacterium]